MRNDKPANLIIEKTFQFSLKIIQYSEVLVSQRRFRMSDQLFRAGTSIGANVREAQNAESKFDFIHKMKIAAKEADEAEYWLALCKHSGTFPDVEELIKDLESIARILDKIISTSKQEKV